MNKYNLIMFDFDGTICSTKEAITHSLERTFAYYKKKIPDKETLDKAVSTGASLDKTILGLIKNPCGINISEWISKYRDYYKSEGQYKSFLYSGTRKLLKSLKDCDVKIVIASNKGYKAINESLEKMDISKYIDLVVAEEKGIEKKPSPMSFHKIIYPKFKMIDKERMIVVGDTVPDILFAKNINVQMCWISHGFGVNEECLSHKPDYITNSIDELKNVLLM